jgi:phosphomevalonate kinase
MKIEIPQNIKEEFEQYCKLNEIKEINDLAFRCFISGFNIEKYGPTPMGQKEVIEKVIEVEKIIEKIVEKEIPITDDSKTQEFLTEIQKLKNQYKDLENLTGEKDSQLLTLSSQTEYYQTQIKGLQNEITRQKEGPLKKLMRGDFLRGSNLKKNLYD